MESYFLEAIKQRIKSLLTANSTSVFCLEERIKSSVEMQWERRKTETEESEPHSKPQSKSDGWRREDLVRECCRRN